MVRLGIRARVRPLQAGKHAAADSRSRTRIQDIYGAIRGPVEYFEGAVSRRSSSPITSFIALISLSFPFKREMM